MRRYFAHAMVTTPAAK